MTKPSIPLSPGCNLSSLPQPRGRAKGTTLRVALGLALVALIAGVSPATAQNSGKVEERSRRVETKAPATGTEKATNQKSVVQTPLVRKTALTYTPRPSNQPAERPALTNDIVIISRAPERSSSAAMLTNSSASSRIPSIWPVVGPLRSGVGMRGNPFGGAGTEYHKGQDISAPMGTPISAAADGIVVVARRMRGYGNGIYIDHGNGITTRYGHLSRIDVAEGQVVKRGQHLGLVGSTGRSTGPHLHYEVRINGQPTSPLAYLPPISPVAPPAAPTEGQQRGVQH